MSEACECCGAPPEACRCWSFPGWGKVARLDDVPERALVGAEASLGTWRATALCGNDITSSCLYVSALATLYAGPLAPLALLLVAGVLYLFRWIYAEVGSALPLNGGAYNVLLNSASKPVAAAAAVLTVLSYMATAVISANEAMHYAARLLPDLPVIEATLALLSGFALLALLGMTESATVALLIFVFHIATLCTLAAAGVLALASDPSVLWANLALPPSAWPTPGHGVGMALFFGFCAGMLGISGFESSANFIEEQRPGVFPKTLRNMWIAVAVFNPLIALLAVGLLPLHEVAADTEALLATLGHRGPDLLGAPALGRVLAAWVSLDAVVVLSGAVLTSFVGVTGLLRRMAMDLVLPSLLLRRNRWRGTEHFIVLGFLSLCGSVLLLTRGRLEALAAVYTLSFLSVMALFAAGNLLLKARRPALQRPIVAPRPVVLCGLGAVVLGLAGNVLLDPGGVWVFAGYAAVAGTVVALMFLRNPLLAGLLRTLGPVLDRIPVAGEQLSRLASRWLHDYACRKLLFVLHRGDTDEIRRVAAYVVRNEPIGHLQLAWFGSEDGPPEAIRAAVRQVDREHPGLRIDLIGVPHRLSPQRLLGLAERLSVPVHHVLLDGTAQTRIGRLAGVRLIL